MEDIQTHTHDGINSLKLNARDVIPTYTFTTTELANYLSRPAINGDEFNCYDGTNYYKYLRINNTWIEVGGSVKIAIGTAQAPASTGTVVVSVGFRPKIIRINTAMTTASYTGASWGRATTASDNSAIYSYYDGFTVSFDWTSSFIIAAPNDTGGSSKCAANLSAIGETSFTLNFQDVTARPYYHWEAVG